MTRMMVALSAFAALGLAGCENLSQEQERALVGGGVGAAGGAVAGEVIGDSPGTGALIGGAGGAATGALTEEGDIPGEELLSGD